jgi:hypothetical protein
LGERHHSDNVYPIGTLMRVGGINEVTMIDEIYSTDFLGVVSNTAGYIMNDRPIFKYDDHHPIIGLIGRIPVRVVGSISKGEKLVSAGNGCAKRFDSSSTKDMLIGWSLETNDDINEKLVLCIIK